MQAPRRKRATSRTNRRGIVNTDHVASHNVAKRSVSAIRPIQIGRSGIEIGTWVGDGVVIATEPPPRPDRSAVLVYVPAGEVLLELPAPWARVSRSDISATIGQPRASLCRSSRLACPLSHGEPGRFRRLQEGTSRSGLPLP